MNNSFSHVNIKLALAFILTSLLGLVASQFILFWNSEWLIHGYFRIPSLWMAFHLLILGFAVMVVMGAMYQMIPVVLLTPIWNERFGFYQYIITISGILILSIQLGLKPSIAFYGGAITIIGILMFLFQMYLTIKAQKQKNRITGLVVGALTFLFLTIIAGFLLAWNIGNGEILRHESIFSSHLLFGLTGWFTLLIIGFSYKLVPMFSLAHGFSMRWIKKAYFIYLLGMFFLILSFWMNDSTLSQIGWLLLWIGFTLFLLDIREMLAKRLRRQLDRSFRFALMAIYFGSVIHFLAFIVSLMKANAVIWGVLIYLYIMTWIIFSILGYLKKIVPVLWWTLKYDKKIGKEQVPALKDLINEKNDIIIYCSFLIGIVGTVIAFLTENILLMQFFQGLLFVSIVLYGITIIQILRK
ncbi:hypothetical protein [Gracilibacillus dipsosauri]|uniref:hypothetical protein n=1 Tax=Gracilibacillus dipsosauri TaxID=178340 RepID=UPI00240A160F